MPTELHLALQYIYAAATGVVEAQVDGYQVDALRDGVIYEVQTSNFAAIRPKLATLSDSWPVVLVYPVAQTKTIVKIDDDGNELSERMSPKHGAVTEVFRELLYIAELLGRERLSLEVVVTRERELRRHDGLGSWRRRGQSLAGRQLVEITAIHRFDRPADLLQLLPPGLPEPFTVRDLAAGGVRKPLASRMAYALWKLGVTERVGKRGNWQLYKRNG